MQLDGPRYVAPMKAQLAAEVPLGPEWVHEVKLDGIRAIAVKVNEEVRLYSRRPREMTADHPAIVRAVRELPMRELVLDGEVVALDEQGRSSFQLLQNVKRDRNGRVPLRYVVFDVLWANGRSQGSRAWEDRRRVLERVVRTKREDGVVRLSPILDGEVETIWREVTRLGLEGVISKRKASSYESGRRTGAWRKIKAQQQQEFVIGGYTQPRGSRRYFGALLVGYYEQGGLRFASAVGTGFDTHSLRSLYERFQEQRVAVCPFANLPNVGNRARGGISRAEMQRCSWVWPRLVCQVKFQEWTRDGNLRQPVFLGLRTDKLARVVRRERAAR